MQFIKLPLLITPQTLTPEVNVTIIVSIKSFLTMLENFRKYSAFMIIIVILLAFGLIVTLQNSGGGSKAGQNLITVDSQGMSPRTYSNEILDPYTFLQTTRHPFFQEIVFLTRSPDIKNINTPEEALAIISLAAEAEAKRLGIFVGMGEVENFVKTTLFINEDKTFDQQTYTAFINNVIDGGLKKTEADFFKILRRYLVISKVAEVKNLGHFPSTIVAKANDINTQSINAQIFQIDNTAFKGTANPSEAEIKAFYEKEKNSEKYGINQFHTKPKIRLTYIPVNLKSIPVADENTPETKIELLKIDQERNYKAYKNFLNDELNDGENKDIEALAKKYNLEVKTTELVDITELSKYFEDSALNGDLASRGSIYSYLFSKDVKEMRRMPVRIAGAHKPSFIHYRIDESQDPKTKTYEQSKEIAKRLLSKELDAKKGKEVAQQLLDKVNAALKAGKNINKIPADKKVVTVFKEAKFNAYNETEGLVFKRPLFDKAKSLPFGSTSELITDDLHSSFIYVINRQVEKAADYKETEFLMKEQFSQQAANSGFGEWLLNYLANTSFSSPSNNSGN